MNTDSDDKVNPSTVALHEYEPLSDCCAGLNCSWLVVGVELIVTKSLLTTGVLPSGGPSHWNVAMEPPTEHSKVYISPATEEPEGVINTTPKVEFVEYKELKLYTKLSMGGPY